MTPANNEHPEAFISPTAPQITTAEQELIRQISACVILHPGISLIRKQIASVVAENEYMSEPRHLILIGESGCGKTTLLDLIRSRQPKEQSFQLGIHTQQPALILSLPSSITPRSMAIQMLRALGDHSAANGTCQELTERLVHYIKSCNVKAIFLDEFQHLLALGRGTEHGANQRLLAARNWIKSIIVATHVTFVLMGMPDTRALINREPQMERRFPHVLSLFPFRPPESPDNQMAAFADALLKRAVADLGVFTEAVSFATNLDHANRLYVATAGVPSAIKDYVIRAALKAYRRSSPAITMGDFDKAFNDLGAARLNVAHMQARNESRRSLEQAAEGRILNPFSAKTHELRPLLVQLAA